MSGVENGSKRDGDNDTEHATAVVSVAATTTKTGDLSGGERFDVQQQQPTRSHSTPQDVSRETMMARSRPQPQHPPPVGHLPQSYASVPSSLSNLIPIAPGSMALFSSLGVADTTGLQQQLQQQQQQQALWQQALQSLAGSAHLMNASMPQQQPVQPNRFQASAVAAAAAPIPLTLTVPVFFPQPAQQVPMAPSSLLLPAATKSSSRHVTKKRPRGQGNPSATAATAAAAPPRRGKSASRKSATGDPDDEDGLDDDDDYDDDDLPPPKRKEDVDLEKFTPGERRRYERNMREQMRSYKISQQIKQLRNVLAESRFPFKSNKFSILVSVADYIKQLQSRAIMLDADHQRLAETIRQTSELVRSGGLPDSLTSDDSADLSGTTTSTSLVGKSDNSEMDLYMVKGVDYPGVFQSCPYAMGVASLDGRILGCNQSFERILGCPGKQLVQQSLFVFIINHRDIFEAMAGLLKQSSIGNERGEGSGTETGPIYWCGRAVSAQGRELTMNITLANMEDGNPKYFCIAMAPSG